MKSANLKSWLSHVCSGLDIVENAVSKLKDGVSTEEEYSQKEYLLQELGHLRDAVSETTEDDLEVEQIEG